MEDTKLIFINTQIAQIENLKKNQQTKERYLIRDQ